MLFYIGLSLMSFIFISMLSCCFGKNNTKKIDIRGNNFNFKIDKYNVNEDPDIIEFKEKYSKQLTNKNNYFIFRFDNLKKLLNSNKYGNKENNEFELLTKFVNFVLRVGNKDLDKVIIIISSPGGYAFEFEESYTQLSRLKNNGFFVTALIDKMCASGGYMLACACNEIICLETSMIGSVGVIGQGYNIKELADKIGIKFFQWKTGEHKGGFPTTTEYSDEDNNRMKDEINKTFVLFKRIVKNNRPLININKIITAKVWYGKEALNLGLVDKIQILDDYLFEIDTNIYDIYYFNNFKQKKSFFDTLNGFIEENFNFNKKTFMKLEY